MNNIPLLLQVLGVVWVVVVWLLVMASLFIVRLFMVPVSCACTLSMLALLVELHTFKRDVEGFWL